MLKDKFKKTGVILEDLDEDNITSILKKIYEIQSLKKEFEEVEDALKTKVKIYLKERLWDKYEDKGSGINVSLTVVKQERLDKEQLREILTPSQFAQAFKITSYEKLMIITPEAKERLKKYVKKK